MKPEEGRLAIAKVTADQNSFPQRGQVWDVKASSTSSTSMPFLTVLLFFL